MKAKDACVTCHCIAKITETFVSLCHLIFGLEKCYMNAVSEHIFNLNSNLISQEFNFQFHIHIHNSCTFFRYVRCIVATQNIQQ